MELIFNYNGSPKAFEYVEQDTYRVCWGITEDTHYEVLFKGPISSDALAGIIENDEYTVRELKEITELSGLPEADSVLFLKKMISRLIVKYDSSSEVNEFLIGELPVWLDKETRVGLALRFASEKGMGLTETTLWLNGMQFPFKLNIAEQILGAIEVYASMCYDNTQKHLAEIQKLSSVEELVKYNYKAGYPDKLNLSM